MSNKVVSRDTIIDGKPVGYWSDASEIPCFILHGQNYLPLDSNKDPVFENRHCYALVVRLGDSIKNDAVPIHELCWRIPSPAELGFVINNHTLISDTEWGTLTVDSLLEKHVNSIFINGKGEFIPIVSPDTSNDKIHSVKCVLLDDCYYGSSGNDIHIYEVSWENKKDKDIKSYLDLPEFKAEFKGEVRKFINAGEISPEYSCDWEHPISVKEDIGYADVRNYKIDAKNKFDSKSFSNLREVFKKFAEFGDTDAIGPWQINRVEGVNSSWEWELSFNHKPVVGCYIPNTLTNNPRTVKGYIEKLDKQFIPDKVFEDICSVAHKALPYCIANPSADKNQSFSR